MSRDYTVDQSHAKAQGDNVGRDKVTRVYNARPSKIDEIVERLKSEQAQGASFDGTIDALQHYLRPVSPDGVVGLEAKLERAERNDQRLKALREKELFAKYLERWSHFASAQELFAFLLASLDQRFNNYLYVQVDQLDRVSFDSLVHEKVVEPILAEIGDEPLGINATVLYGMLFWLAEQCFVRWHK